MEFGNQLPHTPRMLMKGGSELMENLIPFRSTGRDCDLGAQLSDTIFQSPIHDHARGNTKIVS